MRNKTIYRLQVADIQHVAKEVYGRPLTNDEVEKVIEPVGDAISWYDIVADAIDYALFIKKNN